eukprot:1733714-Rhodomonas_salina.1
MEVAVTCQCPGALGSHAPNLLNFNWFRLVSQAATTTTSKLRARFTVRAQIGVPKLKSASLGRELGVQRHVPALNSALDRTSSVTRVMPLQ